MITSTSFAAGREGALKGLGSLVFAAIVSVALGAFFCGSYVYGLGGPSLISFETKVGLAVGFALVGVGAGQLYLGLTQRWLLPRWSVSLLALAETIFMFVFFGVSLFFGVSASWNDYQEMLLLALSASAVLARVGHLIGNRIFRVNTYVLSGWPVQYLKPLSQD